jgi:hypothetical protein
MLSRIDAVRPSVVLLAVFLWAGYGVSVQGQNRVGRPGLSDPSQANPLLQLQQGVLESILEGGFIALEGAVDPSEYMVGPGDQFNISVGGFIALNQIVPISASGALILPEVGEVAAAGRTLEDVQRDARAALRRHYQHVPVEVSLMRPRLFYVHISGAPWWATATMSCSSGSRGRDHWPSARVIPAPRPSGCRRRSRAGITCSCGPTRPTPSSRTASR